MSYTPAYTGSFKKDFKRAVKRGYNMGLLKTIINILLELASGDLHPLKNMFAHNLWFPRIN